MNYKTRRQNIFMKTLGSFTLHFGLKYEIIYQLDVIEYLFVFFQLDMFRAYTPIFRSNVCYNFFTYAAYGVLGVNRATLIHYSKRSSSHT